MDLVTDAWGDLVVGGSFDAFGQRRATDWTDNFPTAGEYDLYYLTDPLGFTGHEHLDNLNLIHMNGRVYSPWLGKFMSADPFITDPENTQNYNRYSYVYNNPLTFIDPSGFEQCHPTQDFECILITGTATSGGGYNTNEKPLYGNPDASGGSYGNNGSSGVGGTSTETAPPQPMEEVVVEARAPLKLDIKDWQVLLPFTMIFNIMEYNEGQLAPPARNTLAAISLVGGLRAARGVTQLTGQIHHGISRTVHKALEAHPNLRGIYSARDPRFVTQAEDLAAHRGYDTFHRNLDAEVAGWVRANPSATQAQFESYLRGVYQRPDVLERFPNGL